MNLFAVLGAVLANVGEVILGAVLSVLESVLRGPTGQQLADGLLDFAGVVVNELGDVDTLSNAEKREEAVQRIKAEAQERSAVWAEHAIRLAVELAVAAVKK